MSAANAAVPKVTTSPPPIYRELSHQNLIDEETTRKAQTEDLKSTPSIKETSALMSIGHPFINDDLVLHEGLNNSRENTVLLARSPSSAHLSKHFDVHDIGSTTNRDEPLAMASRMNNSLPLSRQLSAEIQGTEMPMIDTKERSLRLLNETSQPASVGEPRTQLQLHYDMVSTSTLDIRASSPRSRPSSPVEDVVVNPRVQCTDVSSCKLELPPRKRSLVSIRQLSERITLHDNGALVNRPNVLIRQRSDRQQFHCDGSNNKETPVIKPVESISRSINNQGLNDLGALQAITHQHHDTSPTLATESVLPSPVLRFVPLNNQWTYGQRVFGRYKRTPYFFSGNLATYLGAGMFMVAFDDGTLDYRIRREDIMVREHHIAVCQMMKHCDDQDQGTFSTNEISEALNGKSLGGLRGENEIDTKLRRKSQQLLIENIVNYCPDPSVAPEMSLLPFQHVMVDFSVTPPQEYILDFDANCIVAEVGGPVCEIPFADNDMGRILLENEALTMKQLDCGVAYEDDVTQVSDSEESSGEDMLMTPWQQMTQTFGISKATRPQRETGRRPTISSISQIERLSITHKSRKQVVPPPTNFWQIIVGYFSRGNRKVLPTKLTDELALAEHVRLMAAKLYTMRSIQCNAGLSAPKDGDSIRVVYERAPDGVRAYGSVTRRVEDGSYAVLTEDEDSLTVQVVAHDKVDLLPSAKELEQQLADLERSQRVLFAGQKVQVLVHPGSRFSGRGIITLERAYQSGFHVLLAHRIRLVNVPAEKLIPLQEKKRVAVTITEDQFLVCNNNVKVFIGDQISVKCLADNDDFDSTSEVEKVGLLNGVYSNKTAAVDFADGSTGYEIPPHLIFKRKRLSVPADLDVRSLKNAVLMQASAAAHSGGRVLVPALEEGYQVKADHPRKAAVESCVVIKVHPSSACDLRFSDGTIIFEVFPSQMIIDSAEHQRTQSRARLVTNETSNPKCQMPEYAAGDYVLAWSSRFGRYCSAKISAKTLEDPISGLESASGVEALVSSMVQSIETTSAVYTLVFDYGEQTTQVPPDKITRLDDVTALSHTQRLTNYSIDTMGFDMSPVIYTIGEAVMARVHGTARYYNGIIEAVNEKERVCVVCFDSSERDISVPFSAMFSVDRRVYLKGRGSSTCAKRINSLSSIATSRAQFLSRHRVTDDTSIASQVHLHSRRSSSGSVRNMLKSAALNIFRSSRSKRNLEPRRGSLMITEIGARPHLPER